jgi:hypothetical protein
MSRLKSIDGWRTFDESSKLIFPWYTRNFLETLSTWDISNWKVFEYGSGDSSIWWRHHAREVYSIETNKTWSEKVNSIYIDNEDDFVEYPCRLIENELFDCVIIDNDRFSRDKCTKYALKSLKPTGILIIDNYHQESVPPNIWDETDKILSNYKVNIFHQPGHPDWKTMYVSLNNKEPKRKMIIDRKTTGWGYGTHMGPLITAAMNTRGPIFEMGCGDFSTILLDAICKTQGRYLLSTDTSKEWLSLFLDLKSDIHDFVYVPVYEDDWQKNPKPEKWDEIGNQEWGLVFIDHRPGERRKVDIERFADKSEIIVVHDTEEKGYGYESVLTKFKYRYDCKRYNVYTTVVSNTIDLSSLF